MDEQLYEIASKKMAAYAGTEESLREIADTVYAEYVKRFGKCLTRHDAFTACCAVGADKDLPAPDEDE